MFAPSVPRQVSQLLLWLVFRGLTGCSFLYHERRQTIHKWLYRGVIRPNDDRRVKKPGRLQLLLYAAIVHPQCECNLFSGIGIPDPVDDDGAGNIGSLKIVDRHDIKTQIPKVIAHFCGQSIHTGSVHDFDLNEITDQVAGIIQSLGIGPGRDQALTESIHEEGCRCQDDNQYAVQNEVAGTERQGLGQGWMIPSIQPVIPEEIPSRRAEVRTEGR
jgi:hypothetical protein